MAFEHFSFGTASSQPNPKPFDKKDPGPCSVPRSLPRFGNASSQPNPMVFDSFKDFCAWTASNPKPKNMAFEPFSFGTASAQPNPKPFDKKNMAFEDFSKHPGPCSVPRSLPRFGTASSQPNPKPFDKKNRSVVAQQLKRRQQLPKRQQTPPQSERLQTHANMQLDNGNAETSKRIRPPPLAFESMHFIGKPTFSHEEAQRLQTHANMQLDNGNAETSKRIRPPPLAFESMRFIGKPAFSHEAQRLQTHANMQLDNGNVETSKRIRPPPLAFESMRFIGKPTFSHEEAQSDMYFPTKCAKLVHLKKSKRIIDDVCSVPTISDRFAKIVISAVPKSIDQRTESSKIEDQVDTINEEVHDSKSDYDDVCSVPTISDRSAETVISAVPKSIDLRTESSKIEDQVDTINEEVHDSKSDNNFRDATQTKQLFVGLLPATVNKENDVKTTEVGKSLDDEASKIILCQKNEVDSEKRKLFIRKWQRRPRWPTLTQEQKKFLANAALSSLPVGPPMRPIESPPRHASSELNIDYVARERDIRYQKSWSTLNISELVAPILSEKNPNAKCLCWKLLIFAQDNVTEGQTNPLASRWLLSKLMGSGKEDDELMVSSPHLSIWKKWISKSSPSETCCLSVIRVAMFDHQQQVPKDDIIAGTSCILFLVSESISWEIQRVRLQNLLASIPSGSNLPLLIVVGDACKEEIADPSVTMIERLGLSDADKTRVNLFSVIFPQEHFNGFLSDDKLRKGLQWLAYCSPLQPSLSLVSTYELVLSYLKSSLRDLDNCNASEVSPECCILAFNQALDRVAGEILNAASMNPIHWPCPEIALLEGLTSERMIADMFLPSIGWSSLARIEPVTRAIKGCKLPNFTYDLSFLSQGSHMGSQIPNQKLAFEDCLIKYLTQSSQLLNWNLAVQEASVMVQKGARLELHGSLYYMIPRWVTIFRRICNWRLVGLRAGEASVAYVLDPSGMDSVCKTDADKPTKPNSGMQDFGSRSCWEQPLHSFSNELSFDEMFQACCGAL